MASASSFTYTGERLTEVAFPLGGIGAGCVSLEGRGALRDWEIFGRPNKNSILEWTFAALWCREASGRVDARVLQGRRLKQFVGDSSGGYGHGTIFHQGDGLPCFSEAAFTGTFPVARICLSDSGCPLSVEIVAFSPFVPLDARTSGFPVASLAYRLTNPGSSPVEAAVALNLCNPVGFGEPASDGRDRAANVFRRGEGLSGIEFRNERFDADAPHFGTVALTSSWPALATTERWSDTGWFDSLQRFWTAFSQDGGLPESDAGEPGRRMPGTLALRATIEPGQTVELPLLISWVFPNAARDWAPEAEPRNARWTRWYATQWPTAWDAATEFWSRREELMRRSQAFADALYGSALPHEVVESIGATASTLRTPTCERLEDGTFWAWEGCSEKSGCCHGSCSHVWNYALTHAYLFPELQRSMLEAEFRHGFFEGPRGEQGGLEFRIMLPLGAKSRCDHAASDGQLGQIMQVCRDWRLSGDDGWLKSVWPSVRRALEYAWVQWDTDRDGLVDGDQHNTYDINFQGPNPLTQFMYLGALRAGVEMARALGDPETAETYRSVYESGRKLTEERLWNGAYFVQTNDCTAPDAPKYQHGTGCLSDQLLGQWLAQAAGLGDLVDPELIQTALRSILEHNFKVPLGDHVNLQRIYAIGDEPGLILCSWPHGGRPAFPFPYSDEVWTGIEYQVAAHAAHAGLVEEALRIVRGVRSRHDGTRRNPYNEFECGSHYARAMSSYGLLLALTGFRWDGRNQTAEASPKVPLDGPCFFCTPHGWGTFTISDGRPQLDWVERA